MKPARMFWQDTDLLLRYTNDACKVIEALFATAERRRNRPEASTPDEALPYRRGTTCEGAAHVTVNGGGQAIVGAVTPASGRPGHAEKAKDNPVHSGADDVWSAPTAGELIAAQFWKSWGTPCAACNDARFDWRIGGGAHARSGHRATPSLMDAPMISMPCGMRQVAKCDHPPKVTAAAYARRRHHC